MSVSGSAACRSRITRPTQFSDHRNLRAGGQASSTGEGTPTGSSVLMPEVRSLELFPLGPTGSSFTHPLMKETTSVCPAASA
eukprot:3685834-Rhodomonas_salina.1